MIHPISLYKEEEYQTFEVQLYDFYNLELDI